MRPVRMAFLLGRFQEVNKVREAEDEKRDDDEQANREVEDDHQHVEDRSAGRCREPIRGSGRWRGRRHWRPGRRS